VVVALAIDTTVAYASKHLVLWYNLHL